VKILKRNEVNTHLHLVEGSPADWVTKPAEISPEELTTPEPCSFTGPLHYLSMSHEQAVQEYVLMLDEHISKDWIEEFLVLY
jgi:hypothetical protein